LDQDRVVPVPGSEGGWDPFFSPDGKWLAFFAGTKLYKLALEDGVPVALCDAPNGRGGAWGDDGSIVAALDIVGGLSRVHSNGGRPELITGLHGEVDDGTSHRWPQMLPHGKGVIFTAFSGHQNSLQVLQPGSTRPKLLLKNARNGRYLETGHLIYYNQGSVVAVPMDADRLQTAGPAVSLVSGVARFYGRAAFDVSQTGTLVYARGRPEGRRAVSWIDSSGKIEPLLSHPDRYLTPRLSPDGKRLAVAIEKGDGANVWVYDTSRDMMTAMPTGAEYQSNPIWTPDGEHLVFQSGGKLAWTRSDGSGPVEYLAGTRQAFPTSFSSDGRRLFFYQTTGGKYDLWDVAVDKSGPRFGEPRRLTEGPGSESGPAVSPNGKWLAYNTLVDPVRTQVVVAALTRDGAIGDRKWQVSNRPGLAPVWAKNGLELFYHEAGEGIMAVAYSESDGVFLPAKPRVWSKKRMAAGTDQVVYDLAPDGRRVVALCDVGDNAATPETHLRVVLNFDQRLRERAVAERSPVPARAVPRSDGGTLP
jgi:serine/threonine-protein kinase